MGAGTGRLAHLLNESCVIKATARNAVGDPIVISREVRATDATPLQGSSFWVERYDARQAVETHDPLIVVCAWMTVGADWTPAWREAGVCEYVLIGGLLDEHHKARTTGVYALSHEQPPYERVLLEDVSRELTGIADVVEDGPYGAGAGSVCAVSYRRPADL